MRALLTSLSAVVLATPALAQPQPLTGLYAWQVSADGGSTWSSSITIDPGAPYLIQARASWTDGPTPSSGFAECVFEQIDLIGADASDIFGGASGPNSFPSYLFRRVAIPQIWKLRAGIGASEGGLRIDREDSLVPPYDRVSLGQLPLVLPGGGGGANPLYTRDNPVQLLLMTAVAGAPKVLTISATWTRLGTPATNVFKVYTTDTGTSKAPLQEAVMTDTHIWIRPNASCTADFNGDGLVDFADYLEFLTFYDAQDFRADLNRDGLVDFSDYLDFLTAYDAGC